MSLRHELWNKSSWTRQFIDEYFVFQPLSRNANKDLKDLPTIGPRYEDRYHYTIAGTASDLLIRSLFDLRVHENVAVRSGLEMLGSNMNQYSNGLKPYGVSPWSNGKFWLEWKNQKGPLPKTDALIAAFETLIAGKKFVDLEPIDLQRLARFCILFAWIDHFRRGGGNDLLFSLANLPLDEQFAGASTSELEEDVRDLAIGFQQRHGDLVANASAVASGRTLEGSRDVNGADFDFVADGTLFELKTTIKPRISVEMLRQAVGYWLLDYSDEFRIRRVAIDLPRQGVCQTFDVREDLLAPAFRGLDNGKVRGLFRAKAIKS